MWFLAQLKMSAESDSTFSHIALSDQLHGVSSEMAEDAKNSAKAKRYDRQLRIWGAHGQEQLESCKLCLLNAGPTGAETLKNLVLGGIGAFTVVDGQKITDADLGNNFMMDSSNLGASRAQVVTQYVKELNELVSGSYVEDSPESMLHQSPQFFSQFTMVVATQMRESDVVKLDEICREFRVTLVVVRSYGLAGMLRLSLPEHTIVESKPDNIVEDLRLNQPFPELQQYVDSFNLEEMDHVTLHHLPYVVLLLKAAQAWKQSHNGGLPATSKERADFKESLNRLKARADGDVPLDADNFDEAMKAAFHVWSKYSIPSEASAVLSDSCAADSNLNPSTPEFWIIVAALRQFLEQEGGGVCLPLDGSIPDMHAYTDLFLRLQKVYKERADRDVSCVEAHVANICASLGKGKGSISRDKIKLFCKNARNLRVVRYRPLCQEFVSLPSSSSSSSTSASQPGTPRSETLACSLSSEGTAATAAFYVLFRAVDRFHALHGRFPGDVLEQGLEEDLPGLKAATQQILQDMGCSGSGVPDDYVLEMVRFGAAELHVVAAFIGGMASQEIIKLVTGQFSTVPGTIIYNGIACTTSSFEL